MENPTSGNSTAGTLSAAPSDTSANLGDVSKLSFLNDVKTSQEPDPEEVSTEVAEVTEPQGEVVEEVVEDTPNPTTPEGVITPNKKARDYTGIAPEDIPLFKGMSNSAFAKAREWYNQRTLNQKAIDEANANYEKVKDMQFWSHPDAHRLSPEYTEATTKLEEATTIANYWTNALAAVRENKPVRDLVYSPEGKLMLGEELQPSPQLEAGIMRALQKSTVDADKYQTAIANSKAKFGDRYKQFESFLTQVDNNLLGEVRKNDSFKKLEEGMMQVIPPELRGSKQFQLIAGMGAFIKALTGELEKLRAQVNGKAHISKVAASNGPSPSGAATGESNDAGSMETFTKRLMTHVGRR